MLLQHRSVHAVNTIDPLELVVDVADELGPAIINIQPILTAVSDGVYKA